MKKTKYLLTLVGVFSFGIINAIAATASISAPKQVEVGHSVKATVTVNAAAWNIKINGTGNTNGCSAKESDVSKNGNNVKQYISVSCTANSTGIIKISYSGDITDANGSTKDVSGSTTINVVAARQKSTNNNLKSLSIEGLTISPEFNKDTLEYTATAEPGTEKIKIEAAKADGYASLTGDGEKDVVEGENKFDIVVTSETGAVKTYTLTVTVKEFAPVIVKVNDEEYNLVRKIGELVKPQGYLDKALTIDDNQIEALYNEDLDKTLVYLKNSDGKAYLFEYNDEKYTRYYEFTFKEFTLNLLSMKKDLLPKGYSKYTESFNDDEIIVYKKAKKSNFGLVYAMDTVTHEKNLYQIDLKNGTAQLFNEELVSAIETNNKKVLIVLGALLGVIFIEFIALLASKGKRRKLINKLKSEKVEKVKTQAIKESKEESIDKKIPEKHEEEIKEVETKKKKSKK
ncbi:MAG: cadherin-like beta sandwich domain-containing protein [Bacilli bacterium]|nr:cadherin-like beta sandwich domain-containing protein [Bacilli bacterium]